MGSSAKPLSRSRLVGCRCWWLKRWRDAGGNTDPPEAPVESGEAFQPTVSPDWKGRTGRREFWRIVQVDDKRSSWGIGRAPPAAAGIGAGIGALFGYVSVIFLRIRTVLGW